MKAGGISQIWRHPLSPFRLAIGTLCPLLLFPAGLKQLDCRDRGLFPSTSTTLDTGTKFGLALLCDLG